MAHESLQDKYLVVFASASSAPVAPRPSTSSVNRVTPDIFLQPNRSTSWLMFINKKSSWIFFNSFFSPNLVVESLMCFYSFTVILTKFVQTASERRFMLHFIVVYGSKCSGSRVLTFFSVWIEPHPFEDQYQPTC